MPENNPMRTGTGKYPSHFVLKPRRTSRIISEQPWVKGFRKRPYAYTITYVERQGLTSEFEKHAPLGSIPGLMLLLL